MTLRFFSVNRIWAMLLVATAITWWLGESGQVGRGGMAPVLAIFALAVFKAVWVMDDFMGLRHAPVLWRRLLLGWLITVTSLILLAYWLGLG